MAAPQPFTMPSLIARRLATVDQGTVPFPKSWGWDFDKGDVLTDGAGRTVTVEGEESWRQWVRLVVMSQQAAFAAFPRAYGADLAAFVGLDNTSDAEQVARRVFQAAVLADPRSASLTVTVLEQADDLLRLRLDAKSKRGTPLSLDVQL